MVASSLSTYLEVTRATSGADANKSGVAQGDTESTAQAAKVLAALYAGKRDLPQLRDATGFGPTEILAALSSLAQAGLIELEEKDDTIRAKLTKPAKAALKSA